MGDDIIEIDLSADDLLYNPLYNKGTAFTEGERDEFCLHGRLPFHVSTIEEQLARRYFIFQKKRTMLGRYRFLSALQDRNETLFYRFVSEHVEEMLPLIYTPTVGEASQLFSYLYTKNRGAYISYPKRDKMAQMIDSIPTDDIDVIVVTDGERILGLGDLGVGGMAIPVGKLSLYTLFGGINPRRTLPVVLDVGTNNKELLDDPLYIGWRHERIRGEEYDHFVDSFVRQIARRFPNVLLQWEDFAKPNAYPLLERYRREICSFNDDIQGTASVALAAILAAIKSTRGRIADHRIAILGGGSAGMGIAHLIFQEMLRQGLKEEEARSLFYIVDIQGLIHKDQASLSPTQMAFAQPLEKLATWKVENREKISLLDVVKNGHPTILIGVSTQTGAFSEEIVKTMCSYCPRPIIFPLSNPTSKSEARAEDLINWSNGQAIVATGSPFDPVHYNGKVYTIGQCNNVYIFPGVGLGVVASRSKEVTDDMFIRAAEVLSDHAPILTQEGGSLFPPFNSLREISKKIGIEVAKLAMEHGFARLKGESIESSVEKKIWAPKYPIYRRPKY